MKRRTTANKPDLTQPQNQICKSVSWVIYTVDHVPRSRTQGLPEADNSGRRWIFRNEISVLSAQGNNRLDVSGGLCTKQNVRVNSQDTDSVMPRSLPIGLSPEGDPYKVPHVSPSQVSRKSQALPGPRLLHLQTYVVDTISQPTPPSPGPGRIDFQSRETWLVRHGHARRRDCLHGGTKSPARNDSKIVDPAIRNGMRFRGPP